MRAVDFGGGRRAECRRLHGLHAAALRVPDGELPRHQQPRQGARRSERQGAVWLHGAAHPQPVRDEHPVRRRAAARGRERERVRRGEPVARGHRARARCVQGAQGAARRRRQARPRQVPVPRRGARRRREPRARGHRPPQGHPADVDGGGDGPRPAHGRVLGGAARLPQRGRREGEGGHQGRAVQDAGRQELGPRGAPHARQGPGGQVRGVHAGGAAGPEVQVRSRGQGRRGGSEGG
mmetsp:Transcript_11881/g.41650  ORF Transcript_11881/g.41650 Transcript_11881/m.41650 type:complete len:237 (+) Transcript_11881:548-1258(+)